MGPVAIEEICNEPEADPRWWPPHPCAAAVVRTAAGRRPMPAAVVVVVAAAAAVIMCVRARRHVSVRTRARAHTCVGAQVCV